MPLQSFLDENNKYDLHMDISANYEDEYENFLEYVKIDPENNKLAITFQKGPRKECGVNGVQLDILLVLISHMMDNMNIKFPCKENVIAISHIAAAIHYLKQRTKRRISENKEGLNQE